MTFDVHQHLWPAAFVAALQARSAVPFLRGGELVTPEGTFSVDLRSHDPEQRIAQLDRDEIDVAVLSLQPSLGIEALAAAERDELEQCWLDATGLIVAAAGGRFRAFAPWRVTAGFAGTSVGASALVDGGPAAALLSQVEASGGVLYVHPECEGPAQVGQPDWWNWAAGYTGQMQRAYLTWLAGGRERLPSLRIVFAMLAGGAPFHHERLTHRGVNVRDALDPNALFDTASYGRRAIELCIETFGVERLVYGSDTPVVDSRPTLQAVRGFGDSVAQILQTGNPGRLFA